MTEFEEYELLMLFHYNDKPLIGGLNEGNYFNSFNKEWDHIMPVVEQIESIKELNMYWVVKIELNFCEIYNKKHKSKFYSYESSKLQSVYKACIEFIKYYNAEGKN